MTTRRFLQLDVFSPRAGAGNPLAVVLDAEGLDDASMQAIARWTRLPETTFVFPPQAAGASYRLRMFSPQKEVPFAGHPSVGTAHAVLQAGLAKAVDGVLVQDGIAGPCPCASAARAQQRIAIRTPRAQLAENRRGHRPAPAGGAEGLAAGQRCRRRGCRADAAGGWCR